MIDLADPIAAAVGDEQIAAGVQRDAGRAGDPGRGGLTAVAGKIRRAIAGEGGDRLRGMTDLADAIIGGVGDEQIAAGVQRDAGGAVSTAAVACPPSPLKALVPSPATVEIVPLAAISRTRLSLTSVTKRSPEPSTAIPQGSASSARVAALPSPL